MEVSYLVGDLEEVDLDCLRRQGLVRVKIGCRDSRELKGETQVFFNGDSLKIKWVVESGKNPITKEPTTSKFDRHRDRANEEEEEEEDARNKYTFQQLIDKQHNSQIKEGTKGAATQQKGTGTQKETTCKENKDWTQETAKEILSKEGDITMVSGGEHILTQQSATEQPKDVVVIGVNNQPQESGDVETSPLDYDGEQLSDAKVDAEHNNGVGKESLNNDGGSDG